MVHGVAARVTGNSNLALDVTQEVFVRLFEERGSIRDPQALPAWLHRVTLRSAIDASRRERVRRTEPMERVSGRADLRTMPEEEATRLEEAERVTRALAELPPKYREVLVLRYIEGAEYGSIAAALGLAIGTVKSRLFRAHEALERALAGLREDQR